MSLIYEVNLEIDEAVFAAYMKWLRPHMAQILSLEGFTACEIFERRREDEGSASQRHLLTLHYHLTSRSRLESYLRDEAPRMRADAEKNFAGRFTAQRRVLQPLKDAPTESI